MTSNKHLVQDPRQVAQKILRQEAALRTEEPEKGLVLTFPQVGDTFYIAPLTGGYMQGIWVEGNVEFDEYRRSGNFYQYEEDAKRESEKDWPRNGQACHVLQFNSTIRMDMWSEGLRPSLDQGNVFETKKLAEKERDIRAANNIIRRMAKASWERHTDPIDWSPETKQKKFYISSRQRFVQEDVHIVSAFIQTRINKFPNLECFATEQDVETAAAVIMKKYPDYFA